MVAREWSVGSGPGAHSPSGFAVEVTRRLDPSGVPLLISASLPPKASVLELGAGTGRIIDGLAELGHRTTAVDHSPEMLAQVRLSETMVDDIETCDLGRTFDAVVLATYLVNVPDPTLARRFLSTCRRHVRENGAVFVQRQVPERFAAVEPHCERDEETGDEREVLVAQMDGDLLTVEEVFRLGGCEWHHRFTNRRIGDDELGEMLEEAGLVLENFIAPTWLIARPA